MADSLYCEMFVESSMDKRELAELIAQLVEGKRVRTFSIESSLARIDCRTNDAWDPDVYNPTRGFLFSKYLLEMDPASGVDRIDYIEFVARFLQLLRTRNIGAVAACDFEDELPDPFG